MSRVLEAAPFGPRRRETATLPPCPSESVSGSSSILLLVLLLVFGPKRLPEMGRQLGKGMREFKESVSGSGKDDDDQIDDIAELPPRRATPERRPRRASDTVSTARPPCPDRPGGPEPRRGSDLVEHLTELRHRLIICMLAIVPAFAASHTSSTTS